MSFRAIDNPWRPAYEMQAALGWGVSTVATAVGAATTGVAGSSFVAAGAVSAGMCAYRTYQTWKHFELRTSLAGQPFAYIKASEVAKKVKSHSKKMWLGYGYTWKPIHTQRAHELMKRDVEELLPPDWYLKLRGLDPDALRDATGTAWVHGLEPNEGDIWVTLKALEGHTMVFGTTGAGKTRLAENVIYQAVMRGDAVFVVDPKGDDELKRIVRQACIDAGRPEAFVYFHPAFPSKSARLDLLKNFNRITELPSRVAALIGTQDQFEDFAWRAVNQVVGAMLYLEARPSLASIRRTVENGPEHLLERLFKEFFNRNIENWQGKMGGLIAEEAKNKQRKLPTAELAAYVRFYQALPDDVKDEAVDGLMSMTLHNREHLSKILASLIPVLTKLTTGELGKLLSPDYSDINDKRPIYDTAKLINGKHVVYIGLDSLPDASVGAAVGALMLADHAAVAGDRYNYGVPENSEVQLLVDESSEVANMPLIQLLNKGRGAGYRVWLFAQTLPDFIVRLGSEPHARQLLGNLNNLIAMRTKCRMTQDYIVETFGETTIQKVARTHSSGNRSEDTGIEFQGSIGENLSEEDVDIFPATLLGRLPDLHYIAQVAGGRLIKGRLAKIQAGQ